MEKQNQQSNEPQDEVPVKQQKHYEPPKAKFVALQLQERLLSCPSCCASCYGY